MTDFNGVVDGTKGLRHHYDADRLAGVEPDGDGGAAGDGPADPVAREVERIRAAARRAGVLADEEEDAGDDDVDEAVEEMERLRRRHTPSPS